jgi:hypothetical protein
MLILPTKYFQQLQLTLPNVAMRCSSLKWCSQNRQATIKIDYFTSVAASQIEGAQPIFSEHMRIDNYDSTLIEQLAESWLVEQDQFLTAESPAEYEARITPPIDGELN